MYFMDNRILSFLSFWNEATLYSQNIHRFRTHSKEEVASFNRTLLKRGKRVSQPCTTDNSLLRLAGG
jgi:hypothetical protein